MERIHDEESLLEQIVRDVRDSGKDKVTVFAGHFPLVFDAEERTVREEMEEWGPFSPYSLHLGSKIGRYAREEDKNTEFVLLVDDITYQPVRRVDEDPETGERIVKRGGQYWAKKARKDLFRERSGPEATLPERYQDILAKHGFGEEHILRHDHGKEGREDCLYFSEKNLQANSDREIIDACAREYTELLEEHLNKENIHLVSFVPGPCTNKVCNVALDDHVENLSASHAFLTTDSLLMEELDLQIDELYENGVLYRRDTPD